MSLNHQPKSLQCQVLNGYRRDGWGYGYQMHGYDPDAGMAVLGGLDMLGVKLDERANTSMYRVFPRQKAASRWRLSSPTRN